MYFYLKILQSFEEIEQQQLFIYKNVFTTKFSTKKKNGT